MEQHTEIDLQKLLTEREANTCENQQGETWTVEFAASGAGKVTSTG